MEIISSQLRKGVEVDSACHDETKYNEITDYAKTKMYTTDTDDYLIL